MSISVDTLTLDQEFHHNFVNSLPLTDFKCMSVALLLYMALIFFVRPYLMTHRRPMLFLKPLVVIYNAVQILLNLALLVAALNDFRMLAFTWTNVCKSPHETTQYFVKLATLGWYYYILKLIDLVDTVFFVLLKKNRHVSVLHVYHHTSMVIMTWLSLKHVPAYQNLYLASLNSAIHVILYCYYLITSLGYTADFRLKRSITVSQMTQFVVMIAVNSFMITCQRNPALLAYTVASTVNIIVFLALFINFYVHSYDIKTNARVIYKHSRYIN
ncbi:fatty acid elongase [Heliothis virescens ascovirus 3i]|nr:fatty acid elongase [Heliothis virescens ascovirus 3i]